MTSDHDHQGDDVEIARMVREAKSSFYWGMRRLAPERRRMMYALYAFCRLVDDIADDPDAVAEAKTAELDVWRARVAGMFDGGADEPVSRTLSMGVGRYGLRREDFLAIVDGMQMDASPAIRIRDDDELFLYCDRVACAVGRLSNRIFGANGAWADQVAKSLGEALQLTNILRDVGEDAELDRVYLPQARLQDVGVDAENAGTVLTSPATASVCADIAAIAEARFRTARALLSEGERAVVRPAEMMMHVYHRIFEKLKSRGWERLGERVSLSKAEKLWIVLRYGML